MRAILRRRLSLNLLIAVLASVGAPLSLEAKPCSTSDIMLEYPVELIGPMADWRPQDYNDSQGITGVCYDRNKDLLLLDCNLIGKDPNLSRGEIILDLKFVPTLEQNMPVDMNGCTIQVDINIPAGFLGPPSAPSGAQVFVKDTEFESQYGTWVNCTIPGLLTVSLQPSEQNPPGGDTHPKFESNQIRTIGVKLAMNDKSTHSYKGQIEISRIEVTPSLPFTSPPMLPPDRPLPFVNTEAQPSIMPDGFYIDGVKWLIVGGNWRMLEYGQNFGDTAWFPKGNGASKHPGYLAARLDIFRRAGITLVRVGLLDDGRAVLDEQCHVMGFDDTFKADVMTFLDLAAQYDVKVEFTLVDFLLAAKGEDVNDVWIRGRRKVIEDPKIRLEFIQDFLEPFLEQFGNHPALFGFDLLNEPEWILSEEDGGSWEQVTDPNRADPSLSSQQFRNFVNDCIEKIRLHAPTKFITLGFSCTNIGLVTDFDLDYLAVHYYPYMGDLEQLLLAIPQDKPWVLEEFPAKEDVSNYLEKAFQFGGAGTLLWNLSPEIDDQCYGFGDEERKLREILAFVHGTVILDCDFCGPNFSPPDGYVDVWDLMQFADHWHIRTGEPNWDAKFDLAGPNFGDPDGYVDVWDLMVFADHWHEGQKP